MEQQSLATVLKVHDSGRSSRHLWSAAEFPEGRIIFKQTQSTVWPTDGVWACLGIFLKRGCDFLHGFPALLKLYPVVSSCLLTRLQEKLFACNPKMPCETPTEASGFQAIGQMIPTNWFACSGATNLEPMALDITGSCHVHFPTTQGSHSVSLFGQLGSGKFQLDRFSGKLGVCMWVSWKPSLPKASNNQHCPSKRGKTHVIAKRCASVSLTFGYSSISDYRSPVYQYITIVITTITIVTIAFVIFHVYSHYYHCYYN